MEKERDNDSVFSDVFNQILTCLDDPDFKVQNAIQMSMLHLMIKNPNETLKLVVQFRADHPNLHSDTLSTILIVTREVLTDKTVILTEETLNLTIKFLIDELIDSKCDPPMIRIPSVKGLEELGRANCVKVLEALISHIKGDGEKNFVFVYCLGVLAACNTKDVAPHIKKLINIVLSTMGSIKNDNVKCSYAYAVRTFSEALMECELENIAGVNKTCLDEITQIYDIFLNQWAYSRDPKTSAEVLKALSNMYTLLPLEKIQEQSPKVITTILSLSRRSIDRNSVIKFLASVLKTNSVKFPGSLDNIVDTLLTSLFDLVCVNPDYYKPQTIKGHFEVLRCFDLLTERYSGKVTEMLLIQLRNNSDRERVKSLLVLGHLANTSTDHISSSMPAFIEVLKHMIATEKLYMINSRLLKTITALAQKSFIKDKIFVWFIVRNSCKPTKPIHGHTTLEESNDFTIASNTVLLMLSSTVGTMDELLKRELLNYFVLLDYTENCSTLAKCLSNLFAKNPQIEFEVDSGSGDDKSNAKLGVPSPEAIFARCITLMGNYKDKDLVTNILTLLKSYCVNIDIELLDMWNQKIPELLLCNQKEKLFENSLLNFIIQTIETLDSKNFAIKLVEKLSEQLILYPVEIPHGAFYIPPLAVERGMLLKCMGICVCFLTDVPMIEDKINMMITTARMEKVDLSSHYKETEHAMVDAAKALGYASKKHSQIVFKKLTELFQMHPKKNRGGFFSNLHFIRDSAKETDWYKVNLLVSEAYGRTIDNTASVDTLKEADNIMISFLLKSLLEAKDITLKRVILNTLLKIAVQCLKCKDMQYRLKSRNKILDDIFQISLEETFENLSLFALIIKLGTHLIQIDNDEHLNAKDYLKIAATIFFTSARFLKRKFDSVEDDERNSILAFNVNQSLPEMNQFIKVIIQSDPSPACLDEILFILEQWMKDSYSEVRICCGHILNSSLDVYIKSVKIGCEAPSKFNQTGDMLGKIVPRCIDSNATVRQNSIEILQRILEISNIYESLTIADSNTDWIKELESIRDQIITDDPKEIQQFAGDIACLIASRIPNYQYLQFCKTLLHCLDDHEESSAVGAAVVFKFFIQKKGMELFHAIPELIKDSLEAVKNCKVAKARPAVFKGMLALTKHHPKFVCNEMLAQPVPFEKCVIEFWETISIDLELVGTILDNFLGTISTVSLCEPNDTSESKKIATARPLSMFCVMNELFLCKHIKCELQHKFPELFAMLLTSLATYTNLASPWLLIPAKSPCQIVFDTFDLFLKTVEMEQIGTVLTTRTNLSSSQNLQAFVEILTPMVVGVAKEFSISSNIMKQIVSSFSKYVASPFDGQRIASIGFYAYLVPLKPSGEISSVIMSHLSSALHDPNPIVRGLCIIGFGYVGELNDAHIYAEKAITALLKGIDDYSSDCFLSIPLESQRGLSRVLQSLPGEHIKSFHISLAIRIRPFFENSSVEIREAAITLFGDLCRSKMETLSDGSLSPTCSSEAFKEQLFANLVSLLLHLNEEEQTVIYACKKTFKCVCSLINSPKADNLSQKYLIEDVYSYYGNFTLDFAEIMGTELSEHVDDFIESCIPFLKSHFDHARAFAAVVIGVLQRYVKNRTQIEVLGHKLALLLKDENPTVRMHAARALSLFYGAETTSN